MQEHLPALDTSDVLPAPFGFIGEDIYAKSAGSREYHNTPSRLFRYKVIKRTVDLAAVLLASPVLIPLLFVLACLVRLTSKGPIFFSHRRIRQNGAFFSMWKFRTMVVNSAEVLEQHLACDADARAEWNRTHKLRKDPRVTRMGAFLRKTSLDELPQIWNVISGEMSLVGPRPIVAAEIEKYRDVFGLYCRVKPGVTGLWQVSGRSCLTYPERVSLDARYVQSWSLTADLGILARTLPAVVQKHGAF